MARHDQSPGTVSDALGRRTVPDLQELAAAAGLVVEPPRKPALVGALDGFLADPANLRAQLDRLDDLARAAVAEAAHSPDGTLDPTRFRARHGAAPPALREAVSYWSASQADAASDASARLGLFFPAPYHGMPPDLRARLVAVTPEPPPPALASTAELPAHGEGDPGDEDDGVDGGGEPLQVRLTERAAALDLAAVLRLVEAGKLRCSDKTRRPSAATADLVAKALVNGEYYGGEHGPVASFAWPLLVQAGGLAELDGTRLRLTARGRAALTGAPHRTLRHLWQRWVGHALLDEFKRVDEIKGQRVAGALTVAGPRRKVVAAALARCPRDRWVDVDELFRYMQAEGLDPRVTRDEWKLYLIDSEYGSLGYDGHHDWELLQGRYVLCLLLEYAAPLGLVDVAYEDPVGARDDFHGNWGGEDLETLSRYDGLFYVRLTGLGAYALGLAADYEPGGGAEDAGTTTPLRVLSNLDVVAVDPLTAADVLVLDAYAEHTSDTVWALRRERYLAAVASGRPADELARFLADRGGGDLPATVTAFLDDAAAGTRRLRDLGVARIVECDDPALAVLIAGEPRLRGLAWRCGERHLVVPVATEARFRERLHGLGYALPPSA